MVTRVVDIISRRSRTRTLLLVVGILFGSILLLCGAGYLFFLQNRTLFYVQVQDQDGQPCEGIGITASIAPFPPSWKNSEPVLFVTDKAGRVRIDMGLSPAITVLPSDLSILCDGGDTSTFDKWRSKTVPRSTYGAPYKITIWKRRLAEGIKYRSIHVPVTFDGRPVGVNLCSGACGSLPLTECDLQISVTSQILALPAKGPPPCDIVIKPVAGGIQLVRTALPYEAPAHGYQPQIVDVIRSVKDQFRHYFVESANGRVHACIHINAEVSDTDPNQPEVVIGYLVNATGSRSLEPR